MEELLAPSQWPQSNEINFQICGILKCEKKKKKIEAGYRSK
jgi:hypothetical protein